jgi:hypothetical protein
VRLFEAFGDAVRAYRDRASQAPAILKTASSGSRCATRATR